LLAPKGDNRSAAHAHVPYADRPTYDGRSAYDSGATGRHTPGAVHTSSADDSIRFGHERHHHEHEHETE
jgi:hypothetical protein